MIHLDTSVLIDALSGRKRLAPQLRQLIEQGERIFVSALVLYEWRRGPRIREQLEVQEALFPSHDAISFGFSQAAVAAELYTLVKRPRGREMDIAIAACAILEDAQLWTVNPADFDDIPRLRLLQPAHNS
jgi:predicted nucleic acid-binding protein